MVHYGPRISVSISIHILPGISVSHVKAWCDVAKDSTGGQVPVSVAGFAGLVVMIGNYILQDTDDII